MSEIPKAEECFKAFSEAARSVLYRIIASAETKSDQKAFVLTGYESGYFSVAETFAWIAALGLPPE